MNKKQIAKELRRVAVEEGNVVYMFVLSDDAFDVIFQETDFYDHIESSTNVSEVLRRFYLLMVAEWLEQ